MGEYNPNGLDEFTMGEFIPFADGSIEYSRPGAQLNKVMQKVVRLNMEANQQYYDEITDEFTHQDCLIWVKVPIEFHDPEDYDES